MFKLFKKLKWQEWIGVIFTIGLIVLQVWLELKLPTYMKKITALIISPVATQKDIWTAGGEMLGFTLASVAASCVTGFIVARISASFSKRLRNDIFNKIESFSLEEIKHFSTASLITRTTNDVQQVQMLLTMGTQLIIKAPVMAIWAICEMSASSWQYSVAIAVAVALLISVLAILIVVCLPKFKKMQTLTDDINRVTRENLEGVRVVRAYNAEKFESEKFEKANEAQTKVGLFTSRTMGILFPLLSFIMPSITVAMYLIGAIIINSTTDMVAKMQTLTEITSFSFYAMLVISAFMMMAMIFVIVPRATVSAKRINEVLETNSKIENGSFDGQTQEKGTVEFKNVSFKYPDADEYVLENISFSAKKGETVAFIGSTGSGKSTLINLVPRFYDATDGEILIDGKPIKEYDLHTLRNKLGYVSQKAIMFSGSVKDNIEFGQDKELSNEEIKNALSIACGLDFVENMPEKENSFITQGGTNISGGQKQRLSIARAIAKNPEILVFDDSFSALDYKTDRALRENLKTSFADATKLIIAQRIGTIKDADKIIVLSDGKIAGIGTHKELLNSCEIYKEIALSQLSQKEIENELK